MEQIEQKQAALQEDVEQMKGNIDSMKGDIGQVLLALKNIIATQYEIPLKAFDEVAQTIGVSRRPEPEGGPAQTSLTKQETLLVHNKGISEIPQNKELHINVIEDSMETNQFKAIKERLKVVECHDAFDVGALEMCLYKYNLDMAPNRMQLQNLSQKNEESFKECAQRWREMAARVHPPLLEKELEDMFMSNLQDLYYEKMVESDFSGFSDLVIIGEWIQGASSSTSFNYKKTCS
ncbi:uncharacterized protein LOC131629142 [Vicia villosa]|uniref:uncharacterized protein LOC131629142 n=1 Tax=Vicia villosa TaxID=3911 RepID=UPI00273B45DF|nr:uncharacterized protein LOC131629142 [Vicia villosa]